MAGFTGCGCATAAAWVTTSPHRRRGLSRDWSNGGRGNCGGSRLHRACLGLAGRLLGGFFLTQPLDQRSAGVMADQLRFWGILNDARTGTAWLHHGVNPDEPNKKHRAHCQEILQEAGHQSWHGITCKSHCKRGCTHAVPWRALNRHTSLVASSGRSGSSGGDAWAGSKLTFARPVLWAKAEIPLTLRGDLEKRGAPGVGAPSRGGSLSRGKCGSVGGRLGPMRPSFCDPLHIEPGMSPTRPSEVAAAAVPLNVALGPLQDRAGGAATRALAGCSSAARRNAGRRIADAVRFYLAWPFRRVRRAADMDTWLHGMSGNAGCLTFSAANRDRDVEMAWREPRSLDCRSTCWCFGKSRIISGPWARRASQNSRSEQS